MHVKVEVEESSKHHRGTMATVSAQGVRFSLYFHGERTRTRAQDFAAAMNREHPSGADVISTLAAAMDKYKVSHTAGPVITFALKCSINDLG